MSLLRECGITDISVGNAEELLREKGRPIRLTFYSRSRHGEYSVIARWKADDTFRFTGFSWGYGGSGPNALKRFLNQLGFPEGVFWDLPLDTRLELLVPELRESRLLSDAVPILKQETGI